MHLLCGRLPGKEVNRPPARARRGVRRQDQRDPNDTRYTRAFALVGEKFWNTIPEEYQQIIIEECANAAASASAAVAAKASEYEGLMAEKGMTIIPPEEIDIAAFRAASEAAYEALGFTDLRTQLYKEIGKE